MTDTEVLALVDKLSDAFNLSLVERPKVWFTNGKGSRAGYFIRYHGRHGYGIIWGRKGHDFHHEPGFDRRQIVIHEFAHVLDYIDGDRKRFDPKRPHGPNFYRRLLETIKAAGLSPYTDHDWTHEYGVLYQMAKRDGYVSKPHAWHGKDNLMAAAQASAPTIRTSTSKPYEAKCPACGNVNGRSRRMPEGRRCSCSKCSKHFDPRFELFYKRMR